jgi:hypothetical protein
MMTLNDDQAVALFEILRELDEDYRIGLIHEELGSRTRRHATKLMPLFETAPGSMVRGESTCGE